MIQIRYGHDCEKLYVFDKDAQPSGADEIYWWDYSSQYMCRFASNTTGDVPINHITDQTKRVEVMSAYEDWKAFSLEKFLLQETKHWQQRRDSEPKDKAMHRSLESHISILNSSDTATFKDMWRKTFPDGLCRLVSVEFEPRTDNMRNEWLLPYSGPRLASFLWQKIIPLKKAGISNVIRHQINELYALWPDSDTNFVELLVANTSKATYRCCFDIEPLVESELVMDSLVDLIKTVLEIADPQLIDTVFDDQFKVLLLGIRFESELSSRIGLFRAPSDHNRTPHTIRFLSRVVNGIHRALINEVQSNAAGNSIIINHIGVLCVVDIINALIIGLKWRPSQVLQLAEKAFRPISRHTVFVGLVGGWELSHKFASSRIFGKQVLAGYSISLAERFNNPNWVSENFTRDKSFLDGTLCSADLDSLDADDIYGTFEDAAKCFVNALSVLDPVWLEDSVFCSALRSPLNVAAKHAKEVAMRVRNQAAAKNGEDFSAYLHLTWLVPLVRELKKHEDSASGHRLKSDLKAFLDDLSVANAKAHGSLKLIDSLFSD